MLFLLAAQAAAASTLTSDAVVGRWQTETRHGIVEITRCGASICGALVSSDGLRANPQMRDEKNKDARLRNRPLQGLQMLKGFQWKSGAWSDGTIYNAEDGGTYSATISLTDSNHLRLKGCIVWPLCKTQNWVRVH